VIGAVVRLPKAGVSGQVYLMTSPAQQENEKVKTVAHVDVAALLQPRHAGCGRTHDVCDAAVRGIGRGGANAIGPGMGVTGWFGEKE
jgi:hypothetical protein